MQSGITVVPSQQKESPSPFNFSSPFLKKKKNYVTLNNAANKLSLHQNRRKKFKVKVGSISFPSSTKNPTHKFLCLNGVQKNNKSTIA